MAQETNPYLEPIEELRETFSQLLNEPEVFPSASVADWNMNVDLYYKWIDGGNQPPFDPDEPEPDPGPGPDPGGDDIPVEDIVISRNAVFKIIDNTKKEYIERDKAEKILNTDTEITDEEWVEWQAEEENKYACLKDVRIDVSMLDFDVVKDEWEWTLCTEDLPENTYYPVLTSNKKGVVGIGYLDNNNNWKVWGSGKIVTEEEEILAWMFLPSAYVPEE